MAGVVDEHNHLLGVVTDGDLRRLWDHNIDIMSTKASDFMARSPKTILVDSLAVEAIDLMEKRKITGFLVVDRDNKLVGAFNLHDLLKAKLL